MPSVLKQIYVIIVRIEPGHLKFMAVAWKVDFHCLRMLSLVRPRWWCYLVQHHGQIIKRPSPKSPPNYRQTCNSTFSSHACQCQQWVLHTLGILETCTVNMCGPNSSLSVYWLFFLGGGEVKLSVCFTNYALCDEDVLGNGYIDPRILDLGTSYRLVPGFMP
jgi:hypothetical protein